MSDLTKASRRVSLTLTLGQEQAIQRSLVYRLNGESYAAAIRHYMITGLMEDQSSDLMRKYNEMLRLLKERK